VETVVTQPRPETPNALVAAPSALAGVVLLLGEPQLPQPSASAYLEVSFPDGSRSVARQEVERDPAGEPRAIRIAYQQVGAHGAGEKNGG
jgi:hypothetical protein